MTTTTPEMREEVARLARKGLDAAEIAERMNCRPFGEHWDVDVEQVERALDQLNGWEPIDEMERRTR